MNINSIKPNLYLVGFQKCASSSLFEFIASHPEIEGSKPKETFLLCDVDSQMFRSDKFLNQNEPDWSSFFQNKDQKIKYHLEGSVCHVTQEKALDYISKLEKTKVIFIIRDPIERFISTYNYKRNYLIKEFGNISINEYYNLVKDKKIKDDVCQKALSSGRYALHINNWQNRIGLENILVIGLNELKTNSNKLSEKLSIFLNVDNLFIENPEKKNVTSKIVYPEIHKKIMKFSRLFPSGKIRRKIGSFYRRLNSDRYLIVNQNSEQGVLKESILKEMKNYYKVEYSNYNKFFEKNL